MKQILMVLLTLTMFGYAGTLKAQSTDATATTHKVKKSHKKKDVSVATTDQSTASDATTAKPKKTRKKKTDVVSDATTQTTGTTSTESKPKKTRKRKTTEPTGVNTTSATAETSTTVATNEVKPKKTRKTKTVAPSPDVTTAGTTSTTRPVKKVTNMANTQSPNDKVIGTDSKGRTIYEGKRGGHYYINSNGNKEYIKQDKQ